MKLVFILLISSFFSVVLADDKVLVHDVTNALDDFSNVQKLQDCPEAKDNERLIKQCRAMGVQKVLSQAKSFGISIKAEDVKVCDIDARFLSLAKYVWFCADSPKGQITKIVQKPLFGDCF